MTNFDFLKKDPRFQSFADTAISAENILHIDLDSCVLNCRKAMEFAVKWVYTADKTLKMPSNDTLVNLMGNKYFKSVVGTDIWRRMDFIRKLGNNAAHDEKDLTPEQAEVCLENLFVFLDFVACRYGENYTPNAFDPELLELTAQEALSFVTNIDLDIKKLIEENLAMKAELSAQSATHTAAYIPKPLDLAEYRTRKVYIDFMLKDAGWKTGRGLEADAALTADKNGVCADFVLSDAEGIPLAVVEAKHSCTDFAEGSKTASVWADTIEKKYGKHPVIFLTNGFDTVINDNILPERKCSGIYSRRDLEKLSALSADIASLSSVGINKEISNRYYHENAVKAVCKALAEGKRKALLVMAPGSGKTRTVIALCDVLMKHGRIKNILYLTDRAILASQAQRGFAEYMPEIEYGGDSSPCVFSTYEAMTELIDTTIDDEGKIFTCGHFDLIICDELHISILNKYRDLLSFFDANIVGLTSEPKNEIDAEMYQAFDLENNTPTYCYELSQAVRDGYLVDFISVETGLDFDPSDASYESLSDEERRALEETFESEGPDLQESFISPALNKWISNDNTIKEALGVLMKKGLKVSKGKKLGKTIIFSKNHAHSVKILEIFRREYPELKNFAKIIDSETKNAQSLIDSFSMPNRMPRIAISSDTLETGVDVPELLNIAFFKRIASRAKFRQMIGRGSRLCEDLIDGSDKNKFYVFDFCGNFEFFRIDKNTSSADSLPLYETVLLKKLALIQKLQDENAADGKPSAARENLIKEAVEAVKKLNTENFAVRQHLASVELYSLPETYEKLTAESISRFQSELIPLMPSDEGDAKKLRFDALIHSIELEGAQGGNFAALRNDLTGIAAELSKLAKIPDVVKNSKLIKKILRSDFVTKASVDELEEIRTVLRGLIKHIPQNKLRYSTKPSGEKAAKSSKKTQKTNKKVNK